MTRRGGASFAEQLAGFGRRPGRGCGDEFVVVGVHILVALCGNTKAGMSSYFTSVRKLGSSDALRKGDLRPLCPASQLMNSLAALGCGALFIRPTKPQPPVRTLGASVGKTGRADSRVSETGRASANRARPGSDSCLARATAPPDAGRARSSVSDRVELAHEIGTEVDVEVARSATPRRHRIVRIFGDDLALPLGIEQALPRCHVARLHQASC